MISVDTAKSLIRQHCGSLTRQRLPLADAAWQILAEDVYAPYDIPLYRQSSMDGYAFAWADVQAPLRVNSAVAAGDGSMRKLQPGEAARVFTGAAIPEGADTVVMQEKIEWTDGMLRIPWQQVQQGDHVRGIGADIQKGARAMTMGQQLTPVALAFLAAMGIAEVAVQPLPRITLIITGNELITPGEEPARGKVFEASSFGLAAALQGLGFRIAETSFVRDDLDLIQSRLEDALERSDLVLITGGVSVGDHDHTTAAAALAGVQTIFHKVKQRPGKPLFFGMKDQIPVFGLPGNPSSVLTCFYEYVLPALEQLTNRSLAMKETAAVLQESFTKTTNLTHFLKAVAADGKVSVTTSQESYKLNAFRTANCFVVVPEEIAELTAGQQVIIHLFPGI